MRRFPFRWAMIALVVIAIFALGYWGVRLVMGGDDEELVMATKPVTRGDIEVTVRGYGTLQSKEEQTVVSGAAGLVKEVFFQPGQSVSKGQVLATIDPEGLEVAIKKLEIGIESSRIELARTFNVSPEEVADVDPATALVVRSPADGTVSGLTAQAGSDVPKGTLCSIVDDNRLLIRLQLPQLLFSRIQVGTEITFVPQKFEGRIPGVVTRVDATPIKGDQTYYYDVWVEIGNPGLLKVGDEGTVIFHDSGGDFQQKSEIASFASQEAVTSGVDGRVKTVFARNGQRVKAGDPIIEFEPGEALLSAMELQLDFKEDLIDLEDKKAQMNALNVVSPMDGVALDQKIAVGEQIAKGVPVTQIANYQNMSLLLRVDEMDVPKVSEGQQAEVTIWGPEGEQMVTAVVDEIGAMGDTRDGIASFIITLAVENPGFLRPGMGGEANIFVSKKENVLLCPVEALYLEEDAWMVDVKGEDDERIPVSVEVGVMNYTFAEILGGLEEGQEVIVGMTKDPESPGEGTVRPIMRKY